MSKLNQKQQKQDATTSAAASNNNTNNKVQSLWSVYFGNHPLLELWHAQTFIRMSSVGFPKVSSEWSPEARQILFSWLNNENAKYIRNFFVATNNNNNNQNQNQQQQSAPPVADCTIELTAANSGNLSTNDIFDLFLSLCRNNQILDFSFETNNNNNKTATSVFVTFSDSSFARSVVTSLSGLASMKLRSPPRSLKRTQLILHGPTISNLAKSVDTKEIQNLFSVFGPCTVIPKTSDNNPTSLASPSLAHILVVYTAATKELSNNTGKIFSSSSSSSSSSFPSALLPGGGTFGDTPAPNAGDLLMQEEQEQQEGEGEKSESERKVNQEDGEEEKSKQEEDGGENASNNNNNKPSRSITPQQQQQQKKVSIMFPSSVTPVVPSSSSSSSGVAVVELDSQVSLHTLHVVASAAECALSALINLQKPLAEDWGLALTFA